MLMTRAVWFCLGLKNGVLGMAKCAVIEYLFEVSFCVCCGYSFGLDFWVSNEWWFLGFKWTVVGWVFALYRLVPVEVGGWEGKGYYYYHHFVCVVFSMSWVFSFALHYAMASLCIKNFFVQPQGSGIPCKKTRALSRMALGWAWIFSK